MQVPVGVEAVQASQNAGECLLRFGLLESLVHLDILRQTPVFHQVVDHEVRLVRLLEMEQVQNIRVDDQRD